MTVLRCAGPRSYIERVRCWPVLKGEIAGPVWRCAGRHPHLERDVRAAGSVGLLGDLPDKACELAGDGDRDGRAFLRARCVEVRPAAM